MAISSIIILGAGPAGLTAAIALAKQTPPPGTPPLRITLVELRPELQTIGGTINLTPLAMRYLDYLGAGYQIRKTSINLDTGIEYISMRTGKRISSFWGGIGALRIRRGVLVENLHKTLLEEHCDSIEIQWGRKPTDITESDDRVLVKLDDGTTLEGDLLLGCDGIHSAARRMWVQPERENKFTGRVVAMGFVDQTTPSAPVSLANGEPALRDTSLFTSSNGMLLTSYYEPSRSKIYFASVMEMEEPKGDVRDGWKVCGGDKDALKKEVMQWYENGNVKGLRDLIASCEDWHLWPVYMLPGEGRWSRGRVQLLGDASHAMPPQGESTGLAIEDGMLVARVLERRDTRTVAQLLSDFEAVRKSVIDKYYTDAVWELQHGFTRTSSWWAGMLVEWVTWLYVLVKKRWGQEDHFGGDVREIELPE